MKKNNIIEKKVRVSEKENIIITRKYKLSKEPSFNSFAKKMLLEGKIIRVDFKEISRLTTSINHIGNKNKSEFVSSKFCSSIPKVAEKEFIFINSKSRKVKNPVLAYHLIQSFPIEDTNDAELVHTIGKELADSFLKDNYQYIISTHVDKDHVHNHIIFNSTSFVSFKKYKSTPSSYYEIRNLSDKICSKYDLSIVVPSINQSKGFSYKEHLERKKGTSYKEILKNNIDTVIPKVKSYNEFLKEMKNLGYEIKEGKHIAFRKNGQERFTRSKVLGINYNEENIKFRIDENITSYNFDFIESVKISTSTIFVKKDTAFYNTGLRKFIAMNLNYMIL